MTHTGTHLRARRIKLLLLTVTVVSGACVAGQQSLGLPPSALHEQTTNKTAEISLGRRLFNDPSLSADGTISCASCHRPTRAFSDGRAVAEGIAHQRGSRNAPSLLNVAFNTALTWEGRHDTLESQALEPILNPREQGLRDERDLVNRIRRNPAYVSAFGKVYSVSIASFRGELVARALAAYERTLISGNSQADRFLYGGDSSALSASAQRGLELFRGSARCATCHTIDRGYALYTDNLFHNVNIGLLAVGPRLAELTARVVRARENGIAIDTLVMSDPAISELGRFVVTLDPRDIGRFRTPSLRNVAMSAPYMHNGSIPTLREAIDLELYDHGHGPATPLILTPHDKDDLLSFLSALTGADASSRQPLRKQLRRAVTYSKPATNN